MMMNSQKGTGVPLPVNPIFLNGLYYSANSYADRMTVKRLVDNKCLSPDDGFRAAKWLAQVGFYRWQGVAL